MASHSVFLNLNPRIFSGSLRFRTSAITVVSRVLFASFSSSTPYPLQYELIASRPVHPHPSPRRSSRSNAGKDAMASSFGPESATGPEEMDKSKRKYYLKRRKRMYGGTDSDDDRGGGKDEFVEMRPEVVEFPTLHAREEELYFYDAFAFPWEKDKHYRMVHQLEKKYFPGQGLENAFVQPGEEQKQRKEKGSRGRKEEDKRLLFFEDEKGEKTPRS